MTNKNRLQEQWTSYLKEVLPRDADAIQIVETQRAFYAGAAAVIGILQEIADMGDHDAQPAMQAVEREMHDFFEAIKRQSVS